MWQRVSEHAKKRDYEAAYRLVMSDADDMYLLRLVVQTGPVCKYLEPQTSKSVLQRMNKIVRRGVFEMVEVEWIDDCKRSGHFQQMKLSD